MFGPLGFPELVFLLMLALLIFGPRKLPEIGRTLGKGLAELRKASTELKRSINTEMEDVRDLDPRRLLKDDPPARPAPAKRPEPAARPKPAEAADAPAPADPAPADAVPADPEADDGRVARGGAVEPSPASSKAPTSSEAP